MLSVRNFNPSLLEKVAIAMRGAAALSAKTSIGKVSVMNRKGSAVLSVQHARYPHHRAGFEFLNQEQQNITPLVLQALRGAA